MYDVAALEEQTQKNVFGSLKALRRTTFSSISGYFIVAFASTGIDWCLTSFCMEQRITSPADVNNNPTVGMYARAYYLMNGEHLRHVLSWL